MPTPRRLFGPTRADNGKIYAIGGFNPEFPGSRQVDRTEEFDPTANSWTTRAPLPAVREGLVAVAGVGKVFAIGGATMTSSAATESYDTATNTWATDT